MLSRDPYNSCCLVPPWGSLDTREKRLRRHTATDLHLSVVCLPIRVFFFVSFVLPGWTSLIETEIITAIANVGSVGVNVGEQIRCRIIIERGFWRNDEIGESQQGLYMMQKSRLTYVFRFSFTRSEILRLFTYTFFAYSILKGKQKSRLVKSGDRRLIISRISGN